MSSDYSYEGTELGVFARAAHWKAYWGSIVSTYVGRRVLDVGAGYGATIGQLHNGRHERWVALEPDGSLADAMRRDQAAGKIPASVEVVTGTLSDFKGPGAFDTILYMDVLEHIEDDRVELEIAYRQLAPMGNLIVLAPAHQGLFSPFDAAIGHYRRYSRSSLLAIAPAGAKLRRADYLDCAGLLASLGNRMFLKQSSPTARQIDFWDNRLVPISRRLDPLLRYNLGKSVLVVWQKNVEPA